MLSDAALLVATAVMVPLTLAIAAIDARTLKIPNWSVLAVFVAFLLTGSWGLPFDVFLWRIGYAVATLVVGFLLYQVVAGQVGAGDLKLIAALAPFLSGANLIAFLVFYVILSAVGLGVYFVAKRVVNPGTTGWKALSQSVYYPAGVLLAPAMAMTLVAECLFRFA